MKFLLCLFSLMLATLGSVPESAAQEAYDPLKLPAAALPKPIDLTVVDTDRKRDIPIRVFPPAGKKPAPLVIFSHGLGGSREGCGYLGKHWSARGYFAVFVQHIGSDDSVWRGKPGLERMAALKAAAGVDNFVLRVKDIPAVIDQLTKWNDESGHELAGMFNLKKIGMSGHSFGAVTTQAVSGQALPSGVMSVTDPRITAAVAFSPSVPKRADAKQAFGSVKIPWLLMTGTADSSPIGDLTPESRLLVYPALPPGGKYEVVLDKGEHSAFGDTILPGERFRKNPNHHKVVLALSTAFWDTYLREDAAAKTWLDGEGPRKVLDKDDRWQTK